MSRYREWDLQCKVYVGNLGSSASKHEIESAFGKYGPLRNVWVARNPPGFAFVEFEDKRDAEDAVRSLDGTRCCGTRIRVEMSSGRSRRDERTRRPRRSYRANSSMILHDSDFRHRTSSCPNFASSATSVKSTTATTIINSTKFTTTITTTTTTTTTKNTTTTTSTTTTSAASQGARWRPPVSLRLGCSSFGVHVLARVPPPLPLPPWQATPAAWPAARRFLLRRASATAAASIQFRRLDYRSLLRLPLLLLVLLQQLLLPLLLRLRLQLQLLHHLAPRSASQQLHSSGRASSISNNRRHPPVLLHAWTFPLVPI
uniref:RRM domain-containing protein n=1 Tax=Anopheles atroparvus TaxID=41427 RepID=A0AAG5D5G7_ANOAO